MFLDKIPVGKDAPKDVYVVIEIPMDGTPVKYEVDKDSGALHVDRILNAAMRYPANYGFIPHTLSGDGDPVDVLLYCPYPLQPLSVVRCRPVGVMITEDDSGTDEKLIAVLHDKLYPHTANIKSLKDLPEQFVNEIQHFYENYKKLEKGKWVKVSGWKDTADAEKIILESIERAKSKKAA